MPTLLLLALSLQSGVSVPPRSPHSAGARPPVLLASGFDSDAVHRFHPLTGTPLGRFDGVPGAHSVVLGPDHLLYVCAEKVDEVLRFDPRSGTLVDAFVADDPLTPVDETGGLDGPTAAVFGPGGSLYVASFNTDRVLEYDGSSGAFVGVFVDAPGLNGPDAGMTFGPGGDLFVPSYWNDRVNRYDGATGASLGAFIGAGSGGLSRPRDVEFHTDGRVYVSSEGSDEILTYDRAGNFVAVLASTVDPTGMAFGPHDGALYVTSYSKNYVKRFDPKSGALLSKPVGNSGGVLQGGVYLTFLPPGY